MAIRTSYIKTTRSDKTNTFEGHVYFKAGQKVKVVSKTANYTAKESDYIIAVDTSGGAVTITLPTSALKAGKVYIIDDKGGNAGSNNITVATEGSEKIDGAASATISTNYASLALYSDGSNWYSF